VASVRVREYRSITPLCAGTYGHVVTEKIPLGKRSSVRICYLLNSPISLTMNIGPMLGFVARSGMMLFWIHVFVDI